ncbi:MAG: DUF2500 family protein [Oscillospiraceae bacterium]
MELVIAFAAAVVIYFVFHIITVVVQNRAYPLSTADVFLFEKKSKTSTHTDESGMVLAESSYALYFRMLDSEEVLKLSVSHRLFNAMPDEVSGRLTYRGQKFVSFEYPNGFIR